jgi:F5/8 type C domain-containing protein
MTIRNLSRLAICLLLFSITATAQQVYPSRIGNYCQSDSAVATASSQAPGFSAASAIDGDRVGQNCTFSNRTPCWGKDGGWNDFTRDGFPDWLRVDFGRAHSIGRIVVVTYQDIGYAPRVEPYLGQRVGNNYTIEDYTIEVLNTSGVWVQVAAQEENIDIIREYTFAPITGTAIRINITDSYGHYSRVIEFEAYAN